MTLGMFFKTTITLTLHLRLRHHILLVQIVLCERPFAIHWCCRQHYIHVHVYTYCVASRNITPSVKFLGEIQNTNIHRAASNLVVFLRRSCSFVSS